ncbi:MAG: hypothetical protein IPG93_07545 [Burkholderiales bacterium]|nr:hypothetical protein [Burkholderiales bacterium]
MTLVSAIAAQKAAYDGHFFRARLVSTDAEGRILVKGIDDCSIACDVIESLDNQSLVPGDEVLVYVCDSNSNGIVIGRIGRHGSMRPNTQVVIRATESLSLNCGDSSVSLRADGKVLIKGEDVTVRAKGTQRIRAGTVSIN